MRILAAFALAAFIAGGTASAATLDRGWSAPAAVTALAETEGGVAVGVAWSPRACEHVMLWQPGEGDRWVFHQPGPCPQTSTGRGIAAVATDGRRVVWLSYAGGNDRDWQLWTATPTARSARLLRSASADVDATPPIVVGTGAANGIPYAVGAQVTVIGPRGGRSFSWRAPARVVGLTEGTTGTLGVLLATGHLVTVGLFDGKQVSDLAYVPGDVRSFRIAKPGAIVETAAGIEIRRAASTETLPASAGAHLAGFVDGRTVYSSGGDIREYFRTKAGVTDVLLRHVSSPVLAGFDRLGLAWATARRVCYAAPVNVVPVFVAPKPRVGNC